MPKTTRRRKTNKKGKGNTLSEKTSQKLATISEGTEEETLEGYLEDFEVQSMPSDQSIISNLGIKLNTLSALHLDCYRIHTGYTL